MKSEGEPDSGGLRATIIAAVATSTFEMYDFMVFGFLATFIGTNFFPSSGSKMVRTLEAFSTYSAAFFMRPLGGAIFGKIGDEVGRKKALVLSTALMAIPSLLIGLLPSYATVEHWLGPGFGVTTTVCLCCLRLLQGLALGGQLSGSYVLLVERAPKHQRGFHGALVSAASAVGAGMASGVVALVAALVPGTSSMEKWGWRLPFLIGGAIAPVSIFTALHFTPQDPRRHHAASGEKTPLLGGETSPSKTATDSRRLATSSSSTSSLRVNGNGPLSIVLGRERRRMVLMIGSLAGSACCYYFKVWMLTYLATLAEIVSYHEAALVSTATLFIELPLYPFMGWLADSSAEEARRSASSVASRTSASSFYERLLQHPHYLRSSFIVIGQLCLGIFSPLMYFWLRSLPSSSDAISKQPGSALGGVIATQLLWSIGLCLTSGNLGAFEVETWLLLKEGSCAKTAHVEDGHPSVDDLKVASKTAAATTSIATQYQHYTNDVKTRYQDDDDDVDFVYTGVAIGHNVVMAVFGGLVPTVATALFAFRHGRYPILPFLYVSTICALSLGAHLIRFRDWQLDRSPS